MGLFTWPWTLLKKAFGLIRSIFPGKSSLQSALPALPVLVFLALFALLTLLNYALDLERLVEAPLPILRKLWLPLLFSLVWLLCWLGWWLWRLVSSEDDKSEFPDIDTAWSEAQALLRDAHIGLADVPIFLVVGRGIADDTVLFEAANLSLTVNQALKNPRAPVRVFANHDGIYVSCPGAALLSREAELLAATAGRSALPAGSVAGESAESTDSGSGFVTEVPPDLAQALGVATPARKPASADPSRPALVGDTGQTALLSPAEQGTTARMLAAEAPLAPARGGARKRTHLLFQQEEVERITARLRYLCRLIARSRAPYCPINGVLLVIPLDAAANDEDAQQTGAICRRDLATIREGTQVRSPFFAMVCGLEAVEGFSEFVRRIPAELRNQRLGQDLPLVPDLEPDAARKMIESAVHWICRDLIPRAAIRLFRLRWDAAGKVESARVGADLFHFLYGVRQREKRISLMVTRASMVDQPALFGGCYLAGVSRNPAIGSGFVEGCFRQLLDNQNAVSWTPQAIAEEEECRRLTRLGYSVTWVLIGIAVLIGSVFWPRV